MSINSLSDNEVLQVSSIFLEQHVACLRTGKKVIFTKEKVACSFCFPKDFKEAMK